MILCVCVRIVVVHVFKLTYSSIECVSSKTYILSCGGGGVKWVVEVKNGCDSPSNIFINEFPSMRCPYIYIFVIIDYGCIVIF